MSVASEAFPYLCVDEFLKTMIDARGLKTAFELHLIDCLQENSSSTVDELLQRLSCDRPGLRFLLDLLAANQVIVQDDGRVWLDDRFLVALRYRDLLEAKLDFANLVAPDFLDLFSVLVENPEEFMSRARLFDLFGYHRCFEPTAENYELTRRWMRFTTALTKYEADACLRNHDFSQYRKLLDIGGNSGEFVLRICKQHPGIFGTIVDLPLVCDIGQQHVFAEPEAERIRFRPADALNDPLPSGFDLVTFKSVLHDWPEAEVRRFITKAADCLAPGGTLLIFERGTIEFGGNALAYGMLPMLLFFRSFRLATVYEKFLESTGFVDINVQRIVLETPFHLVTAQKPKLAVQ